MAAAQLNIDKYSRDCSFCLSASILFLDLIDIRFGLCLHEMTTDVNISVYSSMCMFHASSTCSFVCCSALTSSPISS